MTQNKAAIAGVGNYLPVNGLQMYYEIHGSGEPLIMLHGGMSTIGAFYRILPVLARSRQVIAVEQQGHGHTADTDRPFSFDHLRTGLNWRVQAWSSRLASQTGDFA